VVGDEGIELCAQNPRKRCFLSFKKQNCHYSAPVLFFWNLSAFSRQIWSPVEPEGLELSSIIAFLGHF